MVGKYLLRSCKSGVGGEKPLKKISNSFVSLGKSRFGSNGYRFRQGVIPRYVQLVEAVTEGNESFQDVIHHSP